MNFEARDYYSPNFDQKYDEKRRKIFIHYHFIYKLIQIIILN